MSFRTRRIQEYKTKVILMRVKCRVQVYWDDTHVSSQPRTPRLPHAETRRAARTHRRRLVEPRRRGARPVLRLRHHRSRGAKAGAQVDRHRRHPPRHQSDRKAPARRLRRSNSPPTACRRTSPARAILANRGREDKNYYFEFEKWALSLIAAQPGNMGKKGADGASTAISISARPHTRHRQRQGGRQRRRRHDPRPARW